MNGLSSLPTVRSHRSPAVLQGFLSRYSVGHDIAEQLFDDVLQWLWLCAHLRADRANGGSARCQGLSIVPSLRLVDEMWHVFVLHTAEYREFCDRHLGGYVDHLPETRNAHDETSNAARVQQLEAQFEYVYDNLGAATLRRWHVEYAQTHTLDFVSKISVPLRTIERRRSS